MTRHGRSGQRQDGVDITGYPEHLKARVGSGLAGAQCKCTDVLAISDVTDEVAKAVAFQPALEEYIVCTSAPRDATLQKQVRTSTWPFQVRLLFWDDLSLELSGQPDLLAKHFPGWVSGTPSEAAALKALFGAASTDFAYDDEKGLYRYQPDLNLRLRLVRKDEWDPFDEPWVRRFPDKKAFRQQVDVEYGDVRIKEYSCAYVDGARYIIPFPRSATDLTITPEQYHIGTILNEPIPYYGFQYALDRAGISVR